MVNTYPGTTPHEVRRTNALMFFYKQHTKLHDEA